MSVTIPGATIRRVAALPELPELARGGPYWRAGPGAYLLSIADVADFLVRDGQTIDVAAIPDAEETAVTLYLRGSVRAALVHQRGELPLHAATLVPPGGERGVAFCGPSGAGKSTLSAELVRRGWTLAADDLSQVAMEDGRAMVTPSEPVMKLWQDACDAIGADTATLARVREGIDKFYLPVPGVSGPVHLAAAVEISREEGDALIPLSGVERMGFLSQNASKPRQIAPMGQAAQHVRIVSQVASAIEAFRLPGGRRRTPAELADTIEAVFG